MENYNRLNDYRYKLTQGLSVGEDEGSIYNKLPERRLLSAVLERAVLDLEHPDRNIRRAAEIWFESQNSKEVLFSYRFICNHLDLEPIRIKKLAYTRRNSSMVKKKIK